VEQFGEFQSRERHAFDPDESDVDLDDGSLSGFR